MLELTLTYDRKVINTYQVTKDVVLIGRDPTCDIRIDNVGISRHHARIERQGNTYVLVDLESGNGTFVGGRRIQRHNLNDGDEIGLWNYSLICKLPARVVGADAVKAEPQVTAMPPSKKDLDMTIMVDPRQLEMKQKERASTVPAAYLVYADPRRGEQSFSLLKTATFFGSDRTCDFKLKGWFIQPRHAVILRDETGFRFINFAKHKRGTVNGNAVDDRRLQTGDTIRICHLTLKYFTGLPGAK